MVLSYILVLNLRFFYSAWKKGFEKAPDKWTNPFLLISKEKPKQTQTKAPQNKPIQNQNEPNKTIKNHLPPKIKESQTKRKNKKKTNQTSSKRKR